MNTNDEIDLRVHNYLLDFVLTTENDFSTLTTSIKATIAQFICHVKKAAVKIATLNHGMITTLQILQIQINVLRDCVIDIQRSINSILEGETLQ